MTVVFQTLLGTFKPDRFQKKNTYLRGRTACFQKGGFTVGVDTKVSADLLSKSPRSSGRKTDAFLGGGRSDRTQSGRCGKNQCGKSGGPAYTKQMKPRRFFAVGKNAGGERF